MEGIMIKKLEKIHEDERGETYETNIRKSTNLIIGYRKKGSKMGQHYHKGMEESKNPEIFILLKGKVKFLAEDMKGNSMEKFIEAPSMIIIEPYIYHEFEAVDDVIFMEPKPKHDEYKDVWRKG